MNVRLAVLLISLLCFAGTKTQADTVKFKMALPQNLSCNDFHKNDDGSWSTKNIVTFNDDNNAGYVTMGPGASFGPGVIITGIDVHAALNKSCS
jgi:hypothetical protein